MALAAEVASPSPPSSSSISTSSPSSLSSSSGVEPSRRSSRTSMKEDPRVSSAPFFSRIIEHHKNGNKKRESGSNYPTGGGGEQEAQTTHITLSEMNKILRHIFPLLLDTTPSSQHHPHHQNTLKNPVSTFTINPNWRLLSSNGQLRSRIPHLSSYPIPVLSSLTPPDGLDTPYGSDDATGDTDIISSYRRRFDERPTEQLEEEREMLSGSPEVFRSQKALMAKSYKRKHGENSDTIEHERDISSRRLMPQEPPDQKTPAGEMNIDENQIFLDQNPQSSGSSSFGVRRIGEGVFEGDGEGSINELTPTDVKDERGMITSGRGASGYYHHIPSSSMTGGLPHEQRIQYPQIQQRQHERPTLGKRGPECMRRCIAQGVLHPVQCHSLC